MADKIKFNLDGNSVEAEPGETIWEVAKKHGTTHTIFFSSKFLKASFIDIIYIYIV